MQCIYIFIDFFMYKTYTSSALCKNLSYRASLNHFKLKDLPTYDLFQLARHMFARVEGTKFQFRLTCLLLIFQARARVHA
jgi:hypothetical protein